MTRSSGGSRLSAPAQNARNNALVVTSIDLRSDLVLQKRCYAEWKSIGFRVLVVNAKSERNALLENGYEERDLLLLDSAATGEKLFRRPVPKIRHVLEMVLAEDDFERFLIASPDVFPAMRSRSIVSFWEQCAPALALVRQNVHSIDVRDFRIDFPDYERLGGFFATRPELQRIRETLASFKGNDRLCLGVPGWDYVFAALACTGDVQGKVMASGVLLHVPRQASYGSSNDFSNLLRGMKALKLARKQQMPATVAGFHEFMRQECEKNATLTRAAKQLYFAPAPVRELDSKYADLARTISRQLIPLAPVLSGTYSRRSLHELTRQLRSRKGKAFELSAAALVTSRSTHTRFLQVLLAILFALKSGAAPAKPRFERGGELPLRVRVVCATTTEASGERRLAIAELFGQALSNDGVFNWRLFSYLCLSCSNDSERRLLRAIRNSIYQEKENAAPAA